MGRSMKFKTTPSSSRSIRIDSLLVRAAEERKQQHNISVQKKKKNFVSSFLQPRIVLFLSVVHIPIKKKRKNTVLNISPYCRLHVVHYILFCFPLNCCYLCLITLCFGAILESLQCLLALMQMPFKNFPIVEC